MRKLLLSLLMCIIFNSIAYASPYLACAPNLEHEWYEITGLPAPLNTKNNTKLLPIAKDLCDDGKPCTLIIDLETLPANVISPLKIQVKGCNIRGCSAIVPFVYTLPALPSIPLQLKLTK